MDAYSDVPVDVLGEAKFDAAVSCCLGWSICGGRADEMMPLGSGAVYTASVVLWLLAHL